MHTIGVFFRIARISKLHVGKAGIRYKFDAERNRVTKLRMLSGMEMLAFEEYGVRFSRWFGSMGCSFGVFSEIYPGVS